MLQASHLMAHYTRMVNAGQLQADPAQERAAQALAALYLQLTSPPPHKKRLFGLLPARAIQASGLYLWGDVGRGKSMLMDLFVEAIRPQKKTCRIHFHAFMLDVHKRLHAFRQRAERDVLPMVIDQIATETEVLCLDEMQVHDVADAMILSRLFAGLMDAGVTVLFTSNRPPRQLYQDGLQRDQFLKFVDLLERRIPLIEISSPTDYRLQQLTAMQRTFMFPRDSEADDFLLQSWERLTHGAPSEPLRIDVQGRTLRVDKHCNGIAWLTFGELCVRPLGASDYLELATLCHTLLLQGIPALTPEYRNEAKRFVTLIDALYDHRVKLIATAATAPEAIYAQGDGHFEFQRTVSRLMEMQSESYLALAHGSSGVGEAIKK